MEDSSIEYNLLGIQRALLREVSPELRAVFINLNELERRVRVYFYHEGDASEEQADAWDCVTAEATADLDLGFFTETKVERVDHPKKIPSPGYCAYLRQESDSLSYKHNLPYQVKIEKKSRGYALLAVQDALLGVVTPALRGVVIDLDEENSSLYIRFYYDKEVSESQIALWQNAIAEVGKNFAPNYLLDGVVERMDYPKEFPFRGGYGYWRKEAVIQKT